MTPADDWRQIVPWPRVGQAERVVEIAPAAEIRAALARRLDLQALGHLEARLVVRPWLDGLEIEGVVEAVAERICGVTLEPYEEPVRETVALRLLPPTSPHLPGDETGDVIIDLEAEDPPEPGEPEGVDLAAVVAEAVALGLAPFARKPGATFAAPLDDRPLSPFAALAALSQPTRSEP